MKRLGLVSVHTCPLAALGRPAARWAQSFAWPSVTRMLLGVYEELVPHLRHAA